MAFTQYEAAFELPTLLMHNAQLADPLNKYARSMKEFSSKRKKVEADHRALADLEYEGSLYLNDDKEVIVPSRVLEAMLAEGAKKTKEGKLALSSTFVDTDAVIEYDGGPLSVEELVASEKHRLTVNVRVQTNRIMRTRPLFRNVKGKFIVSLDTEIANAKQLENWLHAAFNQVGIGDWRPRYGRGLMTDFRAVSGAGVDYKPNLSVVA